MSKNYSFQKTVYRIRHLMPTNFGWYEGNTSIGTFEFLTEKNARRYIKEQKMKDVVIDKVIISTTESIITS